MIDFRYHVVSLVSVFIALAVGIVLGAGPLQEQLGTVLNHEVDQLRVEKNELRDQLDQTQAALDDRDSLITALDGQVTAGALAGRTVAVVTLPGASNDQSGAVVDAVRQAGGTVAARIGVNTAWTDADQADARATALAGAVAADPSLDAAAEDVTGELAQALAAALLSTSPVTSPEISDAGAEVLAALTDAGLVSTTGSLTSTSYGVVVVAPSVETATAATATDTTAADAVTGWLGLTAALDARGGGSVVVGPASSADQDGLVRAVRQDPDRADEISTVDDAGTVMGALTAVLALREQFGGSAGAYGFAEGADAPAPESAE